MIIPEDMNFLPFNAPVDIKPGNGKTIPKGTYKGFHGGDNDDKTFQIVNREGKVVQLDFSNKTQAKKDMDKIREANPKIKFPEKFSTTKRGYRSEHYRTEDLIEHLLSFM